MKRVLLLLAVAVLVFPLSAQDSAGGGAGFSAALNLGSDLLPSASDPTKLESWSKLGLQPDLSLGKFGIGLDLTFRFQLYPDPNTPFQLYEPDWVPQAGQTIFDVYLPKIMYVRYGLRGVDPFYVKLGSIDDFSLGNGLIVSNYANTRFLPDLRIFGLQFGLDGELFKFPYAGIEALTGNLARLDVIGGRVFVRPLAFLGTSLPAKLQLGITGVMDRDPLAYTDAADLALYPSSKATYVIGADLTLPVLRAAAVSLNAFVEGARQTSGALGAITGVGGRLLGFIDYGAQLRALQGGFIPAYFDTNYDFYRDERFAFVENLSSPGDFKLGWLASLGFSLFDEALELSIQLDGPFSPTPSPATDDNGAYPHLKGGFVLAEGLLPGIFLTAGYEKYFIGRKTSFFKDLIDPEDAVIGMSINYKTGATVLTLGYVYSWDPTTQDFDVSSSLSASVRF
ncbi:MAG: hypothetical protein RBT72_08215 [Spirochaetia bacterium]|jgi:hypothetical protein|nr:hypothetical protein [Spirochaetales bacterium]MDX9784719.1 hypothetical protein [Spirochaetia bacterium]